MKRNLFLFILAISMACVLPSVPASAQARSSFTSSDLKTFQLQGHVKQVVECYGDYTETFSFDKQGKIILPRYRYSDEVTFIHKLKRNSSGRISEWETMIDETAYHTVEYYTYNAGGFITSMVEKYDEDGSWSNTTYTYVLNEKGWPSSAKIRLTEGGYGNNDKPVAYKKKTFTMLYTYSNIDAHGNWLKCTVKCREDGKKYITTRKITYWQ